ncbi:hypothetical protein D8S78_09120 [Natrialba swarupiae]|nr:hypothetical protein [Natrialba swarupiae]
MSLEPDETSESDPTVSRAIPERFTTETSEKPEQRPLLSILTICTKAATSLPSRRRTETAPPGTLPSLMELMSETRRSSSNREPTLTFQLLVLKYLQNMSGMGVGGKRIPQFLLTSKHNQSTKTVIQPENPQTIGILDGTTRT